jgi:hypothetical protein
LKVARIDNGPLFYKINKSNTIEKYTMNQMNKKVSLNDASFVLILKKRAAAAGLEIVIKYQVIVFELDQ